MYGHACTACTHAGTYRLRLFRLWWIGLRWIWCGHGLLMHAWIRLHCLHTCLHIPEFAEPIQICTENKLPTGDSGCAFLPSDAYMNESICTCTGPQRHNHRLSQLGASSTRDTGFQHDIDCAQHPQELGHARLVSSDWALLGVPERDGFTSNLPATDTGGEPQSGMSSCPWSMDGGSKYGHSSANASLPAPSMRDTGFQHDIDPQDHMLHSDCEDQASAFQSPPSSAFAWSMQQGMEGDCSEPKNPLCSLCDTEWRESTAQGSTYSDSISVQHFEGMDSDDYGTNSSETRTAPIQVSLPPARERGRQYDSSLPLPPHLLSRPSPSSESGHSELVCSDELSNLSPQTGYSGNVSPCQLSSPSPQSVPSGCVSSDHLGNTFNAAPNASHAQQLEDGQRTSAMKEGDMPCNLNIVLASAMSAGTWHG